MAIFLDPLQKSSKMDFDSKKISFQKLVFLNVYRTNNVFVTSFKVVLWRPKNGHCGPKLLILTQKDTYKLKMVILAPSPGYLVAGG